MLAVLLSGSALAQSRWREALRVFEERGEGLKSDAEQAKRVGADYISWAYALPKTGQSQRAGEMAASFSYAHPAFWAPFSLVGDGGW